MPCGCHGRDPPHGRALYWGVDRVIRRFGYVGNSLRSSDSSTS
jgi:hypothetical protein